VTTAPSAGNGHADGNVDIFNVGYPLNVPKHAIGTYTGGTCSTARCHGNGTTTTPVTWGTTNTVGCRFCHPNLSAGHAPHVGDLFTSGAVTFYTYTSTKSAGLDYKFGCANCHPLDVGQHLNTTVEVNLTASASGGHLKALNGASPTYSSSQCSSVYCHSNGYKPGASFTYATTPVWGGTFTGDPCANCHGNSPNSIPATKPGSPAHTAHLVGIHYDNTFNGVSGKLPLGGAANINAAHGKDHRATTINCNICHANTVTTSANDNNTLCAGCHNDTTAGFKNALLSPDGLVSNAAKHVNGSVDVAFINQKIATKAQVANTAFAAYTANASGWIRNSNGMPYKTYTSSYDYTKSTLSAGASPYTQADGCLNIACHASIPIKWTATNVSCESCHTRLK
jgi:predicted CxxxxCH...CXXCH cytochrome family protein